MRLSGSKVQIRLRISLDPLDPGPTGARPTHKPTRPGSTSSEDRCVPSVVTDGQSYRLAQATAGKGVIPCALTAVENCVRPWRETVATTGKIS